MMTIPFTVQNSAYAELAVCWIAWTLAFARPRKLASGQRSVLKAPASRWGILFNFLGFGCVCAYVRPTGFEKTLPELVAAMLLAPPAVLLVWSATRHLGKQWRFEAAISEDHELVSTGVYAKLRHPIYASMLLMLLATGAAYTWWPMLVLGFVLFSIGIEIRVQAEDRLLAEHFQDVFFEYRGRVRAYIPFIR
jgi:protein-S-isoprenylcysteine O-methyltransferase Ste14